ncbi:MAG: PLP-dependent aminotransferase family protein [Acidaminococcaceae bacterium]|nr:PLP-dependent aminotransferase family protein [Acidaminococcaceae bacterium]
MPTVFNFRVKEKAGPLYKQLALYFQQEILKKHLKAEDKLPSIRELTTDLNISRTTVLSAYQELLSLGYIKSVPHIGYLVAFPENFAKQTIVSHSSNDVPAIKYNFSNNYIDTNTFDTSLWRRYLSRVLSTPSTLAGYGDPQGEFYLRKVLAKYSYDSRGVVCTPDQIIVGAGLQSLLDIILPLLVHGEKSVGLEEPGFPQAEQILKNFGWHKVSFNPENFSLTTVPRLIIISPSNPYKGSNLNDKAQKNLIAISQLPNHYLIEDDYNGEFRYLATPTPALYSFGNSEQILYLGSFSRTMLPSLRISYLVLPQPLLPMYEKVKKNYNQTSSTIEQLALAKYIEDGCLAKHVKKLRSLYKKKNALLRKALKKYFRSQVTILNFTSGLHLHIAIKSRYGADVLASKALQSGIKIIPVLGGKTEYPEFLLSFAGIAEKDIDKSIKALQKVFRN